MQSIVRKAVRPFTVALKGIILTLIICATGQAWAVKLGEGITAYYPFNIGTTFSGYKWSDGALTADTTLNFDCSGGTITSNGDNPKFGSSNYMLSGGGDSCKVYKVDANSAYPAISGNWSMSLWVIRNDSHGIPPLYCHGPESTYGTASDWDYVEPGAGQNGGIYISLESGSTGKIKADFYVSSDSSTFSKKTITSASSFTWSNSLANWHSIILTRDGTTVSLYVDGTLQGSVTINAEDNLALPDSSKLSLSKNWAFGTENGAEDLCFWNRALTLGEVVAIAAGTKPIDEIANSEIANSEIANILGGVSLEESGGYVTTAPQLAFKNTSLTDITAETIKGRFGGGNVTVKGQEATFRCFGTPQAGVKTCEAQISDGGYIKAVRLTFMQVGDDVVVSAVARFLAVSSGGELGKPVGDTGNSTVVTDPTTAGYALYNLRLTRTYESDATVVWNAGEFDIAKIGADGLPYTWGIDSSCSTDEAGVLSIGSNGGLTMTVPSASAIYTGRKYSIAIDAYVPSFNAEKTIVDSVVNGSHVSVAVNGTNIGQNWGTGEIGSYGKGTFSAGRQLITVTFEGRRNVSNTGTTTFINGVEVAYSEGLKSSDNNCTALRIGNYNGNSEIATGMKIFAIRLYDTKIDYGESARVDTQVKKDYNDNNVPDAIGTVASDGTITWDKTLPDDLSAYRLKYIVNDDATLDIGTLACDRAYFNVAVNKTLTLSSTVTASNSIYIEGAGKVSVSSSNALSGKCVGSGTIVYSGVLPRDGNGWTESAWTGTVWLKDYNNGSTRAIGVNKWCNSGSKVKFTNVKGHLPGMNNAGSWELGYAGGLLGELILEDDGDKVAFDRADGWSHDETHNSYCMFAKLSGSGTLKDSKNQTIYLVFRDASAFTGNINVTYGTSVIIGDSSFTGTAKDRKIIVDSGKIATIANGKTWAPGANGFEIAGTLAFNGTGRTTGSVTTSSGSTLDFTEATGSTHISGTLTVDSGTTIKFLAGATFPYQVATSVSGSISDSTPYYVGDTAYTGLAFSDGKAYPKTAKTITGNDSWNSAGWAPGYGGASDMGAAECSVDVTANATLNLGTASAGKVTFNLNTGVQLTLTGTLSASEINFTGSGKVVCSAANTLQGTIKGSSTITIEYPAHIVPTGATWTDTGWCGTLVLTNCGFLRNSEYSSTANHQEHFRTKFEEYGSVNSKIKAPGFKGYAAVIGTDVDAQMCNAELVIDAGDDNQVELNHGWSADGLSGFFRENQDAGFKFAKLSGDGHLKLDGDTDFAQYVFCDVSGFHGSVNITRPSGGGRKSFLFGVPTNWTITGSEYPANLVIASSMTVAANKTWEVPAGIILRDNPTLTLSSGSTISHLSPASVGTLAVAENATATLRNDDDSVLTTALDITTKLNIATGAKLNISDRDTSPLVTTLTIPADAKVGTGTYVNNGTLDLSGCTALTTLHLVLGSSTGFADLNNSARLVLPTLDTCKTIVYDVGDQRNLSTYVTDYNAQVKVAETGWLARGTNHKFYYQATENITEYSAKEGTNCFTMDDVPDDIEEIKLKRYNGTTVEATRPSEGSSKRTYWQGSMFSGTACWHEWDFEQETLADRLNDSGVATSATPGDVTAVALVAAHAAGSITYDEASESKRYIPISEYPHTTALGTFEPNWSAAVRCKMPSGQNKVAVAFGDTSSGILGLATGAQPNMVELFNWTTADGGTYTTLAQLAVESASTAMHIYVLAVSEDSGTKYVTLYRDGELIHTAAFTATSITGFKIGDVIGDRTNLNNLPGIAIDSADPVETAGYVDYVRLYDKTVDSTIAEGLSQRRPFVSAIDLFVRTVTGLAAENWSATGAWTERPGGGGVETTAAAPTPDGNPAVNVSVILADGSSLNLNLGSSDAAYGTLIFNGSGEAEAALRQSLNNTGRIAANMLVVRSGLDLTVDWNAVVRSSGAAFDVAGVDSGAKLTFDFTDYFTVNEVRATTVITLIGNVSAYAYDVSARDRIEVLMPGTLPAYIQSASGGWDTTTTPGMYAYKVTITPDHNAGGDVYYKEGDFTDGMTVYTDPELTGGNETIPLSGDTVVVGGDTTVTASVDDSFSNHIRVTGSTTLNLTSTGTAALAGKTITVDSGSAVNFQGGTFGNITLAGSGTITFAEDTTVESLSGSVGITVAAGKTLTLGSIASFAATVNGTGTVKLPTIEAGSSFDFDAYGNSGSTVELTGFSGTINATTTTALKLSGNMTITSLTADGVYSFAKITGSGNLTFPASATPTSITITELADYTGTINNSSATAVTVTRISLSEDAAGGARILRKTGKVTVSTVYVNDVLSSMPLAYTDDGVYRAVATYNTVNYATFAAAIQAATDSNLASITVLDSTAALPAGYKLVDNKTHVAKYSIAVVKNGNRVAYCDTVLEAMMAIFMTLESTYDYIEILSTSGSFDVPFGMLGDDASLNIKKGDGVTLNAQGIPGDRQASYVRYPAEGDYQYTNCSKANKATTYTWAGGAPDDSWTTIGNWTYVNTSSATVAASRYPQTGDSVVFADGATVTLDVSPTVVSASVSGAVALNGSSTTLTTGSAINLPFGASIAVTGVTLSPTPATNIGGGAKVIWTTSAGTTTYKVVYGTIFSVW